MRDTLLLTEHSLYFPVASSKPHPKPQVAILKKGTTAAPLFPSLIFCQLSDAVNFRLQVLGLGALINKGGGGGLQPD